MKTGSPVDNPERIYLQHKDAIDPTIGRQWCEHGDVFEGTEGHEPIEYVRADLVDTWESRALP